MQNPKKVRYEGKEDCPRCNGRGTIVVDRATGWDPWGRASVEMVVKKCPLCRPKPVPIPAAVPATDQPLPPLQYREASYRGFCACGCGRSFEAGTWVFWIGGKTQANGQKEPGTTWIDFDFPRELAVRYVAQAQLGNIILSEPVKEFFSQRWKTTLWDDAYDAVKKIKDGVKSPSINDLLTQIYPKKTGMGLEALIPPPRADLLSVLEANTISGKIPASDIPRLMKLLEQQLAEGTKSQSSPSGPKKVGIPNRKISLPDA